MIAFRWLRSKRSSAAPLFCVHQTSLETVCYGLSGLSGSPLGYLKNDNNVESTISEIKLTPCLVEHPAQQKPRTHTTLLPILPRTLRINIIAMYRRRPNATEVISTYP